MAFNLAMLLGFFAVSGIALTALMLFGKLIRPSNPQPIKNTTYECGEKPVGAAWFNFNNRFYIFALIFVIFDVEVALTIPIVVIYRSMVESGSGLLVFAELFSFLCVLFVALIYFWARGDLTWDRVIKNPIAKIQRQQHD
jgi:NADH-quinone oxidoreductase subunit A